MILVVAYDLHNPNRDYPKVEAALKDADGGWAHPQGSVWFIDTTESPAAWRDRLKQAVDANDELFVAHVNGSWASFNIGSKVTDWLKDTRRRW